MNNTITNGTEILSIPFSRKASSVNFPIHEDACIIGSIKSITGNLVEFNKAWDTSPTPKSLYARCLYLGRTEIPILLPFSVGQYCKFFRVGEFNSQGENGFELYSQDITKCSWICFCDYYEEPPTPTEPVFHPDYTFYSYANTPSTKEPVVAYDFYDTGLKDWVSHIYCRNMKYHRKDYSSSYYLRFYTGYDSGTKIYSGLYWQTATGQVVSGVNLVSQPTRLLMKHPRTGTPSKESLVPLGVHPYRVNTVGYYVEINEIHNPVTPWQGVADSGNNMSLTDNGVSLSLYMHENIDRVKTQNPVRDELVTSLGPNTLYFPSGAQINPGTTYQMTWKSRKSDFYGSITKYAYAQWILNGVRASEQDTYILLFISGTTVSTGFNDESQSVVCYASGAGIIPVWLYNASIYTNICTYIAGNEAHGGIVRVSKYALDWKKWTGLSWIIASPGDTVVMPYFSDSWTMATGLSEKRTSNQINISFALI